MSDRSDRSDMGDSGHDAIRHKAPPGTPPRTIVRLIDDRGFACDRRGDVSTVMGE